MTQAVYVLAGRRRALSIFFTVGRHNDAAILPVTMTRYCLMSDQQAQTQSSPPQTTAAPQPTFTPAWAASFAIAMTPNMFTFIFSQPMMSLQPTGISEMVLVPSLSVVMSPILAKDLLKGLQRSIAQYEAHIGTISDVPETPIPALSMP